MSLRIGSNGAKYTDKLWYEMWRKSDLDLKLEMSKAAATLLTSTNLGISEKMDAESRYAAADAVILEKKQREPMSEYFAGKRTLAREKAYRRLKAAHTPNGQLVTAILEEEDGKTGKEIKAWCDELQALEETEFSDLLQGLLADGAIKLDDDKYYLLRVCTEDMGFPSFELFKKWVGIKLGRDLYTKNSICDRTVITKDMKPDYYVDACEIVSDTSNHGTKAFYKEDMLPMIDNVEDINKQWNPSFMGLTGASFENRVFSIFEQMVRCGAVCQEDDVYWVPFMCEE